MTVYHGTAMKDFDPDHCLYSRYGFAVLFATTDIRLAKKYAYYQQYRHNRQGYLYSFDIPETTDIIDYEGKNSYNKDYPLLIKKMHKQARPIVKIINITDSPHPDLTPLYPTEVIVIYNVKSITNIKLIDSNVTDY